MSTITPAPAAVILSGGDPVAPGSVPVLPEPRYVIAADSGLHNARLLGIAVDVIVGDFDSADPAAVEEAAAGGALLDRHPADKDATDLELALETALAGGHSPTLVLGGASLDRIDHFLANALLISRARYAGLQIAWWTGEATVRPVHDLLEITGAAGDLVTLLPVGGPATGVVTAGLRWPLSGDTLPPGSTRGVSNEMEADRASVSLESGTLLAVHHEGDR